MNYNWNWGVIFEKVPSGETTYLWWIITGLEWTVILSVTAWILALVTGSLVGVGRTLPNRIVSGLAAAYVEFFRNTPLLVQLFTWYFVVPDLLPEDWGNWFKTLDPLKQQYLCALLCLGLFTSARVAEQVRSGIQSLPRGQRYAGLAMGFTLWQTYRYVLLPMTFRIIAPPMTSEALNIFKNSAVASTIGLIELSRQAQQITDLAARPYESFIIVTALYMLLNILIMLGMHWMERKTSVPGLIGGKK